MRSQMKCCSNVWRNSNWIGNRKRVRTAKRPNGPIRHFAEDARSGCSAAICFAAIATGHVAAWKSWSASLGRYKGCRVRTLPDDYLSFLTSLDLMKDPKWKWLLTSVLKEMEFRGLRADLAITNEPEIDIPAPPGPEPKLKRAIEI